MTLRGKRILVTGGAGFIGSHLVDRLGEEGPESIVVVDNLFLGRKENLDAARTAHRRVLREHWIDATDFDAMQALLERERIDVVFDLAVIPLPASLERPRWSVDENVKLASVICELQRIGLFEKMIRFSSSEAYGSAAYVPIDEKHPYVPSTPYAASKLAGDQVALSYHHTFGMDISILRPFNNLGPRQNDASFAGIIPIVVNRVLDGQPILVFGDGEQTRDYLFVRDTVDAAVRLYETPDARGKTVNVASGVEVSVNELVRRILAIMQKPDHPVQHVAPRLGDVRRHLADVTAARSLFGFQPQYTLQDALEKTVAWYIAQHTKGARSA